MRLSILAVTGLPEMRSADPAVAAERLRGLFRFFAATQCRGRSPVYETLSLGVAADDALLDLLMSTPEGQRRPSLLFAAVNFLLASDRGAALASYYPIHGGRQEVDRRLVPTFAEFCGQHAEELGRLLRDGSTQTNDIRRCVALRLGLGHVGSRWPGPLALSEIGASAGLNLFFDRYRYRVGGRESAAADAAPVMISCKVRGGPSAHLFPEGTPEITSRLGVDLNPLSLTDAAQRAWLEAFIWPEDVDGLATLRGAIDVALAHNAVPPVRGDATTDTARLITDLPGDEPVVVFTATLLSYLDTDAATAFLGQLDEAASRRPVAWLFVEAPGLVAPHGLHIPALTGPLAGRNARCVVGASLRSPDHHEDTLLAAADPYLRWLAPARHPSDDFHWLPA